MWIENGKRNCAARETEGERVRSLAFSLSKMRMRSDDAWLEGCGRNRKGGGVLGSVARGAEAATLTLGSSSSIWNNFIVFTFDFYGKSARAGRGSEWVVVSAMYASPGPCTARRKVHVAQQRINSTRQQQQQRSSARSLARRRSRLEMSIYHTGLAWEVGRGCRKGHTHGGLGAGWVDARAWK